MLGRLLTVKYDTLYRSSIFLRYRNCKRNFNAKIAMPDLQLYSYNINLIQKVENTFVFLTEKVFIFLNFSIALYKQEVLKPRLQRNLKLK